MDKIYLDNAATTPLRPEVIEEMTDCMKNTFGNPSSTHFYGREAKAKVELSRKKIAEILKVQPAEIIFTSCGTEANNLIIRSAVEYLGVQRIITSELEHKCIKETVTALTELERVEVVMVNTGPKGEMDYLDLENKLKDSDKKTLVSLMHANNEVGNLLELEKVLQLCEENDALFHSDTVQSMAHIPLDFNKLKIDFAACSAHKFHGPKGVGFAFIRKTPGFHPQITGGGQERNLRSGTENLYGIVGMTKAFELENTHLEKHRSYIEEVKRHTIDKLKNEIPGIIFNGNSADMDKSLYTILSVSLPFIDSLIGFELELQGIAVSQGSACSSGAVKTSEVMKAVLTEEQLMNTTPLRISFSTENTKEEIDKLVGVLKKIYEKNMAVH